VSQGCGSMLASVVAFMDWTPASAGAGQSPKFRRRNFRLVEAAPSPQSDLMHFALPMRGLVPSASLVNWPRQL
jgi:hypothetical protein